MNTAHERALLLRRHAPMEIPWRTHGILLRAVLFVLTCAGTAAFWALLEAFGAPRPGLVTGVVAIAAAEVLIRVRRWWWTGIEEAWWLAGAFAFVSELPRSGTPESNLVIALAAAVPGFRVRNPLFGAFAAIFVVTWAEERLDLGLIAAMVLGGIAVVALLRTWQRPSTEWLWIALAVLMPVVGRAHADREWRAVTIAVYAVFALLALVLAIRNRHHALFVSGGLALGIAVFDAIEPLGVAGEAKLAAAGALLLAGSWLLARALRERTRGIVAAPAGLTPFDDELEVAATISVPAQNFDQRMETGGEFGGAGATGKY